MTALFGDELDFETTLINIKRVTGILLKRFEGQRETEFSGKFDYILETSSLHKEAILVQRGFLQTELKGKIVCIDVNSAIDKTFVYILNNIKVDKYLFEFLRDYNSFDEDNNKKK